MASLDETRKLSADKTNYGSIPDANETSGVQNVFHKTKSDSLPDDASVLSVNTRRAFLAKTYEWGGPGAMLLQAWMTLLPIIVPLYFISYQNLTRGLFLLKCERLPGWSPQRLACDVSMTAVIFFPSISRTIAMGIVSFALVRKRIFYTFLRHKLLIDLDNTSHFTVTAISVQMLFFAIALLHLALLLGYGIDLDTGKRLLTVGALDIISDPAILLEPEQRPFLMCALNLIKNYVVPGAIAIAFTLDIDDTEKTLIPLSKMYEAGPIFVHQHLSRSVALSEDVARQILLKHDPDDIDEEKHCAAWKQIVEEDNMSKACELFREQALAYDGIYQIGKQWDTESMPDLGCNKAEIAPLGVFELMSKKWWPLYMVLKDESDESLPKPDLEQFTKHWGVHCLLCAICISADLMIRCAGFYGMTKQVITGKGYMCVDSYIFWLCAWLPFVLVCLKAVTILGRFVHHAFS